jgi:hypothetical protein
MDVQLDWVERDPRAEGPLLACDLGVRVYVIVLGGLWLSEDDVE